MTWEERQRPIETATNKELEDCLYDWTCGMNYILDGFSYPSDYPRNKSQLGYTKKGEHLCYYSFKKECNKRGVYA